MNQGSVQLGRNDSYILIRSPGTLPILLELPIPIRFSILKQKGGGH